METEAPVVAEPAPPQSVVRTAAAPSGPATRAQNLFEFVVANARVSLPGMLIASVIGYHASLLAQWLYSENPYTYLIQMSLMSGYWSVQRNTESVLLVMFCALLGFVASQACFVVWCLRGDVTTRWRGWFQLRLLTTIVLMLLSAGALYLCVREDGHDLDPAFSRSMQGWPIGFVTYARAKGDSVWQADWNYRFLLRDIIFFAVHLFVLTFALEAYLRHRENVRARATGAPAP